MAFNSSITGNPDGHLTRSEVWSADLKETLKDELMGMKYVKMLDGFPDGDTFKIPSIGDARTDNYAEDTAITYRPMDTGQFEFSITEYVSSGTYITKKAMQDMYYMNELVSTFVPKQNRAIMERYEAHLMEQPETAYAATPDSRVTINGAHHRLAGGDSGKLALEDFAYADYSLTKANVPAQNRIAIVDPSAAFKLDTLTNLVNVSDNPRFEGIVSEGFATGMRFVKNVYGFDVYMSNYLPNVTASALPELDGTEHNYSSTNGKACYFFSGASDVLPLVSAWRQMPEVDSEFNKDFQREEYVTTARWGSKLYRPENMVMIAHDPTVGA